MTARYRRCGHDTGPLHPGDQQAIAEFTVMLAARKKPAPWTGQGDIAVRIGEYGLARGRPRPDQQPDTNPVALALIHPDTGTALTATLHCAQFRIHGAWAMPYRLLTHAFAGRDLPADIDLST
ncbi:hypothetical protein [Streptomyces sp. NPDC006638]|uniref:hypothetical protein n=1 Tax=Streptomyces sp. NPDC006638 TaxID=3157183 RepID=UPI0033A4DD0A